MQKRSALHHAPEHFAKVHFALLMHPTNTDEVAADSRVAGKRLSNGWLRLPPLDDQEGHVGGKWLALLDQSTKAGDQSVGRISEVVGNQ